MYVCVSLTYGILHGEVPNDDEDDEDFVCKDCDELSTFQLVVKYAPRYNYEKK